MARRKRKPTINVVDPRYQPKKAELEEPIEFPEGTIPQSLARGLVRPVNIRLIDRPGMMLKKKRRDS